MYFHLLFVWTFYIYIFKFFTAFNAPLCIQCFYKLFLKNEALCDFPMKKIPGTCRSGTGTAPCGTSRFCNSWIDEPWRASARRFKTSEGLGQNSRARGLKRPPPKRYAKRGGGACLRPPLAPPRLAYFSRRERRGRLSPPVLVKSNPT